MQHRQTLALLAKLTSSSRRQEVIRELAHHLGADDLAVLVLDREADDWKPAAEECAPPILEGADWRVFLSRCRSFGQHAGTLPRGWTHSTIPAIGILAEDQSSLLVLLGGSPCVDDLLDVRLLLPLLIAALGGQVRLDRAERPRVDSAAAEEQRPLRAALESISREANRLEGNLALADRLMLQVTLALNTSRSYRRKQREDDDFCSAKTHARILTGITQALAEADLDPESVLDHLAQHIAETFGSFCAVRFLSEDRHWLNIAAACHYDQTKLADIRALLCTPHQADEGLNGRVLRTNQPILLPTVNLTELRDALKAEMRAHLGRFPVHSLLIVPLGAHGTPIGTLSVTRDCPRRPFTLDDQVFLQGIASQIALAVENTRLCRQIAEREKQLQDVLVLDRLQVAEDEERRRIAYEVHDGLAQMAASVHQHLQAFARYHTPHSPEAREQLDRTLELAHQTVREAREIVAGLRPTVLDDFGLAAAIRMRVEEFARDGWDISYQEDLGAFRLPPLIELHLYRIALEALTNISKHAGTTRARIHLRHCQEKASLEVHDGGRGFSEEVAQAVEENGEHTGLSSMRERIQWLGGHFTIESRPGRGTTVTAIVPLSLKIPAIVREIETPVSLD